MNLNETNNLKCNLNKGHYMYAINLKHNKAPLMRYIHTYVYFEIYGGACAHK